MRIKDQHEANLPLPGENRFPIFLWLIWVIWLPFAIPNIIDFFQSHPSLPRLVAISVAIVCFFAIYLWATWRNVQHLVGTSSSATPTSVSLWLPIVLLFALSVAIVLLYKGIGTPFIFTSAYIGGRLPFVRAIQAVITLALLMLVLGSLTNPDWSFLGQGIVFVLVVGIVTISMVRSVTIGRELRVAREEIARLAVTTERLRIARDLHDLLGHNLSLITLKSELAGRLLAGAPARAAVEISDIENVARTTLQEVREAVGSYRQPTLSSELHAAQEILAAAAIAYRFEGDENSMAALPTAIESVLAWTVREGVTNVIRHSRAHHCIIHATREGQTAAVEVLDDGTGISLLSVVQPPDAASTSALIGGGNGLRGLAERVEALGGHYEAGSRPRGGFRLFVSLPLVQKNLAAGMSDLSSTSSAQPAPLAVPERSSGDVERTEQR